MKIFISIMMLWLGFLPLSAQDVHTEEAASGPVWRFLLEGAVEWGGDALVTLEFTNGEERDMNAGQGGSIHAGAQLEFPNSAFMLRGHLGFKYLTTPADNASVRLTRWPVVLMGYYKIEQDFRLGAGVLTHLGTSLKGDGFFDDIDFNSSMGGRIEFGWKWIAMNYSFLKYTPDVGNVDFSANSVGITGSYAF